MTSSASLVIRPRGPRIVAYGVSVALIVMTVVIGVGVHDIIRMTWAQGLTLLLLLVGTVLMLHSVARSVIRADPEQITVVNGYKRHQLTWDQVAGISMKQGAPWPTLVTTDDELVNLFALQRVDGDGREVLSQLRAWAA
jgi:hypothetical protein